MTPLQKMVVRGFLERLKPSAVAHGACIGADDELDLMAAELGIPRRVFPSDLKSTRVHDGVLRARTGSTVTIAAPARPLERNKKIVELCSILLAAPKGPEVLRSGTWHAVRYGRKIRGLVIHVVLPGGMP